MPNEGDMNFRLHDEDIVEVSIKCPNCKKLFYKVFTATDLKGLLKEALQE